MAQFPDVWKLLRGIGVMEQMEEAIA